MAMIHGIGTSRPPAAQMPPRAEDLRQREGRLHLAEGSGNNDQGIGYRPWMRNGVTMTGNADQCYMGQKYRGVDTSDVVLQWSDNPASRPYSMNGHVSRTSHLGLKHQTQVLKGKTPPQHIFSGNPTDPSFLT